MSSTVDLITTFSAIHGSIDITLQIIKLTHSFKSYSQIYKLISVVLFYIASLHKLLYTVEYKISISDLIQTTTFPAQMPLK